MTTVDETTDQARVRVERRGPDGVLAWVILQRPEMHNALDAGTVTELAGVFDGFVAIADGAPGRRAGRRRTSVLRRCGYRLDARERGPG